jgi:hypothetical protein
MDQSQPPRIAEGDMVLIRARVRHVWHDGMVVRIAIGAGSAAFHQLSVPATAVIRELGQEPAAVAIGPLVDQV